MNLTEITKQFALNDTIAEIKPFGNGWINDTYQVIMEKKNPNYVLQRINHNIFKDVELLQQNIKTVTDHIRKKLEALNEPEIDRRVLTLIPTVDGKLYYYDGTSYWRMMIQIRDSKTYETVTPEFSYYAGKAFGEFESMLVDVPEELGETIPDFHNLKYRLETFREAIAQDIAGRLEKTRWMVDELLKREEAMCLAERLHEQGLLPKRINHCDTKVNNMLFDENGKVLCVIDLDTTMPNFVFSDFGDYIRTAGNTGAEDDENLDNISLNKSIFEAYSKGYIEGAKSFLLPAEIDNLPYGAMRMTYMQTVRFLMDYLNGDTYYKIKNPEHNWQRSLAQFKLLQELEKNSAYMSAYINSLKD